MGLRWSDTVKAILVLLMKQALGSNMESNNIVQYSHGKQNNRGLPNLVRLNITKKYPHVALTIFVQFE